MADDSAHRLALVRYILVYPGLVVVPLAVLTVFRPQFGLLLLLVAALFGAIVFAVFGNDTRAERTVIIGGYDPEGDAPERHWSHLTGRLVTFGIGLFVLAGIAFVVAYVIL